MPVSAYDNAKAIDQMEVAYLTLLERPVFGGTAENYRERTRAFALDGQEHPRIVTLGGDHTIVCRLIWVLSMYYWQKHLSMNIGSSHLKGAEQGVWACFREFGTYRTRPPCLYFDKTGDPLRCSSGYLASPRDYSPGGYHTWIFLRNRG